MSMVSGLKLKTIENALIFAEQIIETVRDPMIVLDSKLRVIFANKSFYQDFRVEPNETIGRLIYDLGNRQWHIPKLQYLLERILPNHYNFFNYEIEHNFESIGKKTMLLNARQFESEELILLAIEDISERKHAEELQQAYLKVKSDFTSMVTHELRSPLAAIKIGLDLIFGESTENLNPEQLEILTLSRSSINRLTRLINSSLDLQKLGSGTFSLDMQKHNINNIVQKVKSSMTQWANEKYVCLDVSMDDSLPLISLDRDKIVQVLVNLISNAIKFTDTGSIKVSTALCQDKVTVSVKDEGIGIEEKNISQLFKPFNQLGNAKNHKEGSSGLGLSISKTIIEAHGGKIWAESKIGEGSLFSFSLPLR